MNNGEKIIYVQREASATCGSKSACITGLDDALVASGNLVSLAKNNLIVYAAKLVTTLQLSEFREDWPKTMPRAAMDEIERHNEELKKLAIELRRVADSII
jgi:hypothetical protein